MGDELTKTVRAAIERHGVTAVSRALGLSAEATCRLGGNLPTQPATKTHAVANLHRVEALDGTPS